MRKFYVIFILTLILSFALGYVFAQDWSNNNENVPGTAPVTQNDQDSWKKERDPLKEQIEAMTLNEKIGQMVIVGIDSYENDEHAKYMIENYQVGGFILLKKNIKDVDQLKNLLNSLKESNTVNNIPLFLSVDEEGGSISRLPNGFKKIPVSGKIGSINNSAISFQVGNIIGEALQLLGFNMDFAPVLDINSNPQNPVIGDRAFGSEAELVSKLGIQTMKGLQAKNIISVVKHFPGHGDTSVDSHLGLPIVNHDLERLKNFELRPFMEAINNDVDAIMIAHLLLPQIDPDNPATLSPAVITTLLRKEMQFDGVVITDDLTMGAIADNYDLGEAAVKSINAGSDIILVCHEYAHEENVLKTLQKAAANGDIAEERINESVYRILKLKQKYNLSDQTDFVTQEEMNARITAINQRIMKLLGE
ncbi:MAG: beta-N-acetylhexosaminidase [Clostridia bacterium]|jgi:beta-N-acetylhexosaminidase|nr:beta-N-acetylhexosaminidase [Clostridia bacterium]